MQPGHPDWPLKKSNGLRRSRYRRLARQLVLEAAGRNALAGGKVPLTDA
jgi:hypothetical protein